MIPMEASIHDIATPEVVCFDETIIICYDKVEKHLLELSEYFRFIVFTREGAYLYSIKDSF